jgi:hypothetical protein
VDLEDGGRSVGSVVDEGLREEFDCPLRWASKVVVVEEVNQLFTI